MNTDGHFAMGLAEGLLLGGAAALGIAAVRTGWLPRRARGHVVRPGLWGRATLVMTASLALQSLSWATLDSGVLQFVCALVSGAGMITSVVMRHRAMSDRRSGPATTPAS
jgi:hypothetical protein